MIESDLTIVSNIVSGGHAFLSKCEGYSQDQAKRLQSECCSVSSIQSWPSRWRRLVAESDVGVVGVTAVDGNEIVELWIETSHHRKGIGAALFRKAEQIVTEAGFRDLTVHCAGSSMQPFYETMHCVLVDVQPCPNGPLAGWPVALYRKELEAQPSDAPAPAAGCRTVGVLGFAAAGDR